MFFRLKFTRFCVPLSSSLWTDFQFSCCLLTNDAVTTSFDNVSWVNLWAAAIVSEPCCRESVTSRLSDLLNGKAVDGVSGRLPNTNAKDVLALFVWMAEWEFKPAALDSVWHAIFDIADERGWREIIRNQTYYWTEQFLSNAAWDVESDDGRGGKDEDEQEYDNMWITAAFGSARLLALNCGYSQIAWNALLHGLGLWAERENSDSMRIGSCAQLLAAGKRIKLLLGGSGDEYATPVLACFQAQLASERQGETTWRAFLQALQDEQEKASSRTAELLKRTREHLLAEADDLTSAEAANIIWPKS